MTTQQTTILSQPEVSTVARAGGSRALDSEHRQHLAVQVLARTEPVTELAKRHGVSRKFVYHQADKGTQALALPEVGCDGDVFHGLQTLTRLATTLEKRAYAAIDQRERFEQNMAKAKRRDRGRSLSKKLARARATEATAVHVADTVQTLSTWLREDILALVGPDPPTRQALYDFVIDTLRELEGLDCQLLAPASDSRLFSTASDPEAKASLLLCYPKSRTSEPCQRRYG